MQKGHPDEEQCLMRAIVAIGNEAPDLEWISSYLGLKKSAGI